MGQSKIEWTEMTWNPVIGCSHCSPGCLNCYAERFAARLWRMGRGDYGSVLGIEDYKWNGEILCRESFLDKPLHWRKPRRIFVNSMSDTFHPKVPIGFLTHIFDTIEQCPQHTFLILTKRPENIEKLWTNQSGHKGHSWQYMRKGTILPNVHLGVSICTPDEKWKADELRKIPAAVRFVSFEPLLADMGDINLEGIGQVIVGGESGPKRRPCKLEWVKSIVEQCKAAGVPVFVKQLDLGGKVEHNIEKFPKELQIREYPNGTKNCSFARTDYNC